MINKKALSSAMIIDYIRDFIELIAAEIPTSDINSPAQQIGSALRNFYRANTGSMIQRRGAKGWTMLRKSCCIGASPRAGLRRPTTGPVCYSPAPPLPR